VVLDEDEFAKTLIPELFKHNNYASFVRQLNMYGFHKRVGLSDNSMKASERKNKSPSEYYNPYFKRGHPNLLWLINKPKGGATKGKAKGRVKSEEGVDRDSDEEGQDIEEVYGNNVSNARALSAAPESGPLQRRDVAVLQNQLAEIQKQQGAITNAISRLRKDHNQLYQQSMAFQTLHDRHENSINAILTFLATVYNRSLDGQGPQNFAQMFANGIPHDQQHQGSVVDIGDVTTQQEPNPGNLSPHRRQQRLLMAPPTGGGRATTASPSVSGATPTPQNHGYSTPQTGAIEELFDNSPADTTHIKADPGRPPPQNMMNIINNTNAQARPNNNNMQFPEMLSHYENANGNSPLTSEQRNTMLNLMANTSSAPGSNNALVSPTPPPPPSLEDLGYTQAEIDELVKLQNDQENRISTIKSQIEPLSPSGSIPGLHDNSYFNGTDVADPNASNLDLDQFLDSGAFYNGSSPMGGGDYSYDHFGDANTGIGDTQFDIGMDGTGDNRIVDTAGSSEAATPDDGTGGAEESLGKGLKSPSKRRRKN
jgi:heat shock transcription factor, other eukaryote